MYLKNLWYVFKFQSHESLKTLWSLYTMGHDYYWPLFYFLSWLYIRIPFILIPDTQKCTSNGTRSSGQHKAHPSELTDSHSHSTAYLYNRFTVESSRDQFIASFVQPLLLNLLLESMFSSAASRKWWSLKVWVLALVMKKPRGTFNMSTQWIKPHTSSTHAHRECNNSMYNTCTPCCLTSKGDKT